MEILIKGISFKQWEAEAESKADYVVSRETSRSIWQFPCGTTIIHNVCMPTNWLKKQWEEVICEWCVPITKENRELAKRYGCEIQEAPYSEDGIGEFAFHGNGCDALERAWKFVSEQRENIISNAKERA